MTSASVDHADLSSFADDVRSSTGWLQYQCGLPCTTAMSTAIDAFPWADGAATVFATRWDHEIQAIAEALHAYVAGLAEVGIAYRSVDNALAKGR